MEIRKELIPANPYTDGTCRTLKRQYQQNSLANFIGGGHIQPREQDFVISEEGISMSLPSTYNMHCFKIMEIVKYEQADKDRQPVR